MKRLICIVFFLNFSLLYSQRLNIAVFYNQRITSCVVSVYLGSYKVYADTAYVATLSLNETWSVIYNNDSVEIRNIAGKFGTYKQLRFVGSEQNNVLKYKPTIPSMSQRYYDDDMVVKAENHHLNFYNYVDMDDYICGVVESESGYQPATEFYKTQAILCQIGRASCRERV